MRQDNSSGCLLVLTLAWFIPYFIACVSVSYQLIVRHNMAWYDAVWIGYSWPILLVPDLVELALEFLK